MIKDNPGKTCRANEGFTLLEVVICVVIIATGFIAVYSLHLQTLKSSYDIRFFTKAPMLAQEKINEITAELKDASDSEGDFGEDFEGFTYKVTISDTEENDILGETVEKLKKIEVQITLNEGERIYNVTAYRFMQPNEE